MRGSGKTFLGKIAADELGWEYLDADEYLEARYSITCKDFVLQRGWPAFRTAETEILSEILALKPRKTVISLGGGIVETESARETLKEYGQTKGPVVHISRDIDQIIEYLTTETERPEYGQEIIDVYNRRVPWFEECRTHQFVSIVEPDDFSKHLSSAGNKGAQRRHRRLKEEVKTFFHHITGVSPNHAPNLSPGRRSYFLSLTFPDIAAQRHLIEEHTSDVLTGVDAIELRADLLSPTGPAVSPNIPSKHYVAQQLALLKHVTSLPVVFTVRTVSQGGAFPDDSQVQLFQLLELGLQLGAEYIDVETTAPHSLIQSLTRRRGSSRIIASYHDWSGNLKWSGPLIDEHYATAARLGDIVKIVSKANSIQDNLQLLQFVVEKGKQDNTKPIIAINLGTEGQLSRILNPTFSPVTHAQLPVAAAPGQLSFAQIQIALHLLGQLPQKRHYLFGHSISKSPSPTLHGTGFRVLGLPHTYDLHETETVDDSIRNIIRASDFGGASVTIPHKLSIMKELDQFTTPAQLIRAVNTVIPVQGENGETLLLGDNTDWLGIYNSILSRSAICWDAADCGLVIGAGGTSRAAIYALKQLGLGKIYIWNRTEKKAKELVDDFPVEFNLRVVASLYELSSTPPAIIVGTIPASATMEGGLDLTDVIFSRPTGGVVVEMAYRPKVTPLLKLASASTMKRSESEWIVVYGVDVLLEQGYAQFERWTSRRAPRRAIRQSVLEMYEATS